MTRTEQIAEHVLITFFEAAGAYLIVIPTVNWTKAIIAGAIGSGLSAVYNLLRQSNPTLPVVSDPIMNGVPQLTVTPTITAPDTQAAVPPASVEVVKTDVPTS